MQDSRSVSPYVYSAQRWRDGCFYCDICGQRWPLSHRRTQTSGIRVGVMCCYEVRGDDIDRDNRSAYAAKLASMLTEKEMSKPLRGPDGQFYPGTVMWSDGNPQQVWITSIAPFPVVLSRGGAAVSVVVTGGGFSATDTFTYGASGITDNSAPSLVSVTEWDLSVKASGGTSPGLYKLTFNSLTIWQGVFDVR